MKKKFLQRVLVLVLTQIVVASVALLEGMRWSELLDYLSYLFISVAGAMLLDDFLAKIIWYRYAITKKYLLGILFYFAALSLFTASFVTSNLIWGIVALCLSGALLVAGIVWSWFAYHDNDYYSFESDRMKWRIFISGIDSLTREEVEKKVKAFLRFRTKRGYLEGNLDIGRPFDPNHLYSLDELKEKDPQNPDIAAIEVEINQMIDDYYRRKAAASVPVSSTAEKEVR